MTYVAAYQLPDFQQSREHGPEWQQIESQSGCLRFRNTETGATVSCPAMWYNLTVEQHCERLRYAIERAKERRVYWQNSRDTFKNYELAQIDRLISQLEDLIKRSTEAGRPLKDGR